jgi:hypothetical protein
VEDTTARTSVSLWKGVKNLLKLINDKLVSGTDIGDVTINNAVGAPVPTKADAVAVAAADVNEPAANTAAVVTYAATASVKHCITGVAWSYSAAPTGGKLTITDDGATVFAMGITTAGAGFVPFAMPKKQAVANKAMVVTLAAGGASATGIVSVLNHWTEA